MLMPLLPMPLGLVLLPPLPRLLMSHRPMLGPGSAELVLAATMTVAMAVVVPTVRMWCRVLTPPPMEAPTLLRGHPLPRVVPRVRQLPSQQAMLRLMELRTTTGPHWTIAAH